MLYREPMWLKPRGNGITGVSLNVSVLYREPMWLKPYAHPAHGNALRVSVLYREPMWLKRGLVPNDPCYVECFSALP